MRFTTAIFFVIVASIHLSNARRIPFNEESSRYKEEAINNIPDISTGGSWNVPSSIVPRELGNGGFGDYSYFDEDDPFQPKNTNDYDIKPFPGNDENNRNDIDRDQVEEDLSPDDIDSKKDVENHEYEFDSREIRNGKVPETEIIDTNDDDDEYEENPPVHGGFFLDSPFFNLEQMTRYIKQLEKALDQVFHQTVEEAALLNGTFANTTEEEIDIDGQKYKVQRSIIKTGDNNSSIFIEAIESVAETNRTKRSNWFSENAQKDKNTDP